MRKVTLTKESTKDILESLLKRSPNNYGKFESTVAEILAKVKVREMQPSLHTQRNLTKQR